MARRVQPQNLESAVARACALIEADLVDTALRDSAFTQSEATPQVLSKAKNNMAALPGQLFYSTQIPVCLGFLAKSKAAHLKLAAMPASADLFPDLFEPFTHTAQFSEATPEAVEKTLTEKTSKPFLNSMPVYRSESFYLVIPQVFAIGFGCYRGRGIYFCCLTQMNAMLLN